MQDLWVALALVLVIEGLLPFASPKSWRGAVLTMAQQSDKSLRTIGFFSMMIGLAVLTLVKSS